MKKSVRKHFPWPSNALRASALSYRSQATGSTDRTAEEMGNSKTILKRAYQELTTEEDAKEWFDTDPHHVSHFTAQEILEYIKRKADGMKLARKLKKTQEADVDEGYYVDEPMTEEEMREAFNETQNTEPTNQGHSPSVEARLAPKNKKQ